MAVKKTRTYLVHFLLVLSFGRLLLWATVEKKVIKAPFDEGAPSGLPSRGIAKDRDRSNSISDDLNAGSAFCLIVKDDNDILAEWVAYHYHVFNMRRLIVAVDPTSETSPSKVLDRFETNFDLDVSIWSDVDYTPEWWQKSQEDPSTLNMVTYSKKGKWECNAVQIYEDNKNQTYQKEDDIERCNHIFRQKIFYSECILQLQRDMNSKKSNDPESDGVITWAVFTDTDEYLVPNPWVSEYVHTKNDTRVDEIFKRDELNFQANELEAMYPDRPTAGSLWNFLHEYRSGVQAKNSELCVMIPRVQFGALDIYKNETSETRKYSIKNDRKVSTNTYWDHKKFESLRWKYHRDHEAKNWPKGMLNVANLGREVKIATKKGTNYGKRYTQYNYEIMKPNMHYPHKKCDRETATQMYGLHHLNPHWHKQPIAHHHYLGSKERFMLRSDARRTDKYYNKQHESSIYARGDQNRPWNTTQWSTEKWWATERWWIKGWFDSFLETHGGDKVYAVLGENRAIKNSTYMDKKKKKKKKKKS